MANIFKKKSFYIILAVIVVAGFFGYRQYQKKNVPPVYDTVKVARGDLAQTVDATGKIESAQDLALRFETAGIIQNLYVKEGQPVKAGQTLANLRAADLNAAVEQASANLNKQLAGQTPEYLAQLGAALDKAKYDLTQIQGENPGAENSKLVQNAYDDLYIALQSFQINLASALTAADNVLGVDNTLANDSFEAYLSVQDPTLLNTAKNKYTQAKIAKNNFDTAINSIAQSSSHSVIDKVTSDAAGAMNAMKDSLFYTVAALNNTPPIGSLTQSSLDTLKTDIQTARTNLAAKYAVVITDVHAVDTARNDYASYQTVVDKAQAALNDAKNPPREVDVASYRAALAQAVANRDKAVIRSPINGVVTKIIKKIGENITAADTILNVLSPNYQIKVDIPETDVSKIKIGDAAEITLDAFGSDVKFTGKITQVELASTEIQDVVYYKVTVSLDKTDKEVKPGMTANVIVKGATRQNALYIPFRSLRTNNGKYVKVLENGKEKDAEVKIGLKADDGKVEILEGLQEGQDVILSIKDPNAK